MVGFFWCVFVLCGFFFGGFVFLFFGFFWFFFGGVGFFGFFYFKKPTSSGISALCPDTAKKNLAYLEDFSNVEKIRQQILLSHIYF